MPGLPIFLSVFFLFTDNPDTVMLIMNSLNIILLYFISLLILIELRFNDYLKIIFLLLLTFFEPFRFIYSHLWTEPFFIFWSLLAALFAVKLLKADNKKYWMLGCAAVALSSFIKMYGVFNCAFFLIPFLFHKKKFSKLIYFVLLSFVFVIIWYIRNELVYGYFTYSHKIFGQFNSTNVLRPFKWTLFLLGNNALGNLWAILLLAVSISPLVLHIKKQIYNSKDFMIWEIFSIGGAVNFLGIYLLSLISSFDYLESRLMAPLYVLLLLILLISIKILTEAMFLHSVKIKYLFLAFPLIFFIINPAFDKQLDTKIEVRHPSEHALWDEINQKEIGKNSSHYITDFNYIHQVYGSKPQRIILQDSLFLNIEFLHIITDIGKTPFIILTNNGLSYFYFENHYKTLNYKKTLLDNKNFTVYIKNEN
jgi:hypothetical protein